MHGEQARLEYDEKCLKCECGVLGFCLCLVAMEANAIAAVEPLVT